MEKKDSDSKLSPYDYPPLMRDLLFFPTKDMKPISKETIELSKKLIKEFNEEVERKKELEKLKEEKENKE